MKIRNFRDPDDPIIPFGKHTGKKISQVPSDYLDWILSIRGEVGSRACSHAGDWARRNEDAIYKVQSKVDISSIPEYTLAEDQKQAADEIVHAFLNAGLNVYRLQGGAGYGKSFAAIDVVLRMKAKGIIIRACAPSYVAAQNLGKDLEPLGVPCATIARTVGMGVEYDADEDVYVITEQTRKKVDSLFAPRTMLIVDEYSMVGNNVGEMLIHYATKNDSKLLVIGDSHQLPCPKQDEDSILCAVEPHSTLTIPKRYQPDSDLFRVEQSARDNPWEFNVDDYADEVSMEVLRVHNEAELYDRFVEYHKTFVDQETLMLWYRRKDMARANKIIRARLFGKECAPIVIGERLRVQRTLDYIPDPTLEPPVEFDDGVSNNERFYSGSMLRVTNTYMGSRVFKSDEMQRSFNIPTVWIQLDDAPRWYSTLFSITETQMDPDGYGGAEFNDAMVEIREWCLRNQSAWHVFRAFRASFLQVAYHYASTVHRVQGQSVDNVFLDPAALRCADPFQAQKLQYVGLTRAKQRLVSL